MEQKTYKDVEAFVDEMVRKREETIKGASGKEIQDMGYGNGGYGNRSRRNRDEITIKFGKGCVGDAFLGKDGRIYRKISIPNVDENDRRPWQSFVVEAREIHDNKFGKGMWCKLPADGHTTLRRSAKGGIDEQGKPIWENQYTKVSNVELKMLVEAYKEKDRDRDNEKGLIKGASRTRESFKEKLAEKKEEISLIPLGRGKEKTMEASL